MGRAKDALRALCGRPVCNGAWKAQEILRQEQLTRWFDLSAQDVQDSARLLEKRCGDAGRIQWLLCNFQHPYGGVFTALRMADHMQGAGWDNQIVIYDKPDFSIRGQWEKIEPYFPNLRPEYFLAAEPEKLPPARAAVATFWTSAYRLLGMKRVQEKFYLIQDYEPAFYPAGTEYALAENTYRMPFHRLYNTPGLGAFLQEQYPLWPGARSISFVPACDARYRCRIKPLTPPVRVLFYARPGTPRNAFSLMLALARKLKEAYGGQVELVAAGECLSKQMREACGDVFVFSDVQPYESLPEFYSSFHFVVAFMLTKHPSYLPFEAMACGCAVLANQNAANSWFFRDGENCLLAEAAVTPMMEAFARGMEPETYERIVRGGRRTVEGVTWQEELKKAERFFRDDGSCKKIQERG